MTRVKQRPLLAAILTGFLMIIAATQAKADKLHSSPYFLKAEEEGKLPRIADRMPENPRVVNVKAMGRTPGKHGGKIRMLIGKSKDIKLIPIYGYARLVGYNEKFELVPDVLAKVDVEDGRIFTFHLRKGHRWSDGHPFTSEDFRYAWEDMLTDKKLGRSGLRSDLLVGGKGPKFEVIDKQTVRYTWHAANPNFLPSLARPVPIYLAMPSHYLRQFHKKHQDKKKLKALLKKNRVKKWHKLHKRKGREKKATNPDLPTLAPWVPTTAPPATLFTFKRNPYFHRIDENGLQLPYVDEITMLVVQASLIPAKAGSGAADLQARNLNFVDYTALKKGQRDKKTFSVKLWRSGKGSAVTLLPNLNAKDLEWRKVLRDVRFRRALSIGIDRHEINQIFFFGLARESADTMLPQSPLFQASYQKAWTRYDPAMANNFLDEMGLTKRDDDGYRLLPSGRRLELIIETAGEDTLQSDILEIIQDQWHKLGVKLITRNSQRDVMRRRAIAGQAIMTIWNGIDNAVASPVMDPAELVPTSESSLQWPQWGIYTASKGKKGEKPDMPVVKAMLNTAARWKRAISVGEKAEAWHEILQTYTDQVFSIGIVNSALQPVVVSNRLVNVPDQGIYAYSPTSYFGVYMPDTFWFKPE